jgi:hypothetical protein
MSKFSLAFVAALLAVAGTQAYAANIVANGGFETGDFTDWTVNSNANFPWEVDTVGSSHGTPFAGSFFASNACVGSTCISGTPTQQDSLSQNLTTIVGDSYTLDFWFGTSGNGNPMELEALFGGVVVQDLLNIGASPYTEYTIGGLVAAGTTTELEFLGRQDPEWDELDAIGVTDNGVAGAPE